LIVGGLVLAGVAPGLAQPTEDPSADETVALACFTPQLGFTSALARNGWYTGVARAMSRAAGVAVQAKGFARVRDLRAFVSRTPRSVLLVNAQLALAQGWRPLMQARGGGGEAAPAMVLASRQFERLADLRGKKVIVTSTGGGERSLVRGLVLAGEVAADAYFGSVAVAPDARSAAAAVSLGKADATIVYRTIASAAGLKALVTTTGVPLPVLAVAGDGVDPELLARLMAGCSGCPAAAEVTGWAGVAGGALRTFRQALGRRVNKRLVPASQAWIGLRGLGGDPDGPARLPLEPLGGHRLLDATPYTPGSDFWPHGEAPDAPGEEEP